MMPERASRTFISSVLFLDIVEYSRKPVAEQIQLKDRFNALIATAIREIAPADRIILDTGDGVAINFLGDPEDALFVAMSLRDAFAPEPGHPPMVPARIGINLGPVRLVRDLNGRPNIIGDGINVAQRVMGFAKAGQILVSRSYYEIVSHISEGYTKLFAYEGSRTDKHVREHQIYSVGYSSTDALPRLSADRAQETSTHAAPGTAAAARILYHAERWLGNRTLAFGTTGFAALAFVLALVTSFVGESPQANEQKTELATPAELAASSHENDAAAASATNRTTEKAAQAANATPEEAPAKPRKLRLSFFKPAEQPETHKDDSSATSDGMETDKSAAASPGEPSADAMDETPVAPSLDTAATVASGQENALVALAIAPWGEVFVDGRRVGVSPPLNEVNVSPGHRTIEIRNGQFPPYRQRVELKARQKIKIRYKFN